MMKFDSNKRKVESFAHDVQIIGDMLGFIQKQGKDHFKKAFSQYTEAHIYKAEN